MGSHTVAVSQIVALVIALAIGLALITAGGTLMNKPNDLMVFFGILMIAVAFAIWARTIYVYVIRTPKAMREEAERIDAEEHARAELRRETLMDREDRRRTTDAERALKRRELEADIARRQRELSRAEHELLRMEEEELEAQEYERAAERLRSPKNGGGK